MGESEGREKGMVGGSWRLLLGKHAMVLVINGGKGIKRSVMKLV